LPQGPRGSSGANGFQAESAAMTSAPSSTLQPSDDEIFLDHIAHFVPEVKAAHLALLRAGFTPTPISIQRNEESGESRLSGTGNVCAMLEDGYIEVLFKTAETPLARELDQALTRYSGVHLIAFAVDDAEAAQAHLMKALFDVRPAVDLRRKVETEEAAAEASFTVVRVEPGEMAEGRIQYLTHHTPGLLWQKRWLTHGNGSQGLIDVVIAVADVVEAAGRYERFLGHASKRTAFGRAFALERGALQLTDTANMAALFPSAPVPPFIGLYGIRVGSLEETRAYFAASGLEARRRGATLVVPFPEGLGQGAWVFVENPRDLPWREGS
jgi:hypothetical protein